MHRLQEKFVLCLEIDFFVFCIILAIFNETFWCQIHLVLLCLHN